MIRWLRLTKAQYHYLAAFAKTIAEGIILGSSAAFFLPETFQLQKAITVERYILILLTGLIFLIFGAILEKKGKTS